MGQGPLDLRLTSVFPARVPPLEMLRFAVRNSATLMGGLRISAAMADFMNVDADETLSFDACAGNPHNAIVLLEARLEDIAESLARCRKVKLASQIAMAGGGVWLAAMMIGLAGFDPVAMMTALAGVIGGTVAYGSNATTAEEFEAEMKEVEAKRAALISGLELRVVGNGTFAPRGRNGRRDGLESG
jgi:hypothetical protein